MEKLTRDELIAKIESARKELNQSIDEKRRYEEIYQDSVRLDELIEQYIVAGF